MCLLQSPSLGTTDPSAPLLLLPLGPLWSSTFDLVALVRIAALIATALFYPCRPSHCLLAPEFPLNIHLEGV